jgi:hypothetical protein
MIDLNNTIVFPFDSIFRVGSIFSGAMTKKLINSINYPGQDYQSVAADGDIFFIPILCSSEKTIIDIYTSVGSNRGIFNLYIDGVLNSSGYDTYNSTNSSSIFSITMVTPLSAGIHEIKLVVTGKNLSSTAYVVIIGGVRTR